jgi:ABC-2 type transport system permease protein
MSDGVRSDYTPGPFGHQFVQLLLARVREFARESEAVFWALFFPILLAGGLGVAFRGGPAQTLQVVTSDARLAQALRQDANLAVREMDPAGARTEVRTGRAVLLAERGQGNAVVFYYDDTNPDGRMAQTFADRAIQKAAGRVDPVPVTSDLVRDPGSRYIDFLVPGLVGLGIMSNTLWSIGFSIVDSRRRTLVKRLVATPMSRSYYLLSFVVWRLVVLIVEVGVPVVFGILAFGVPFRGRLIDFVIICVLASLSFSALALLSASRAKTIEAISGIVNLLQVPMWILSGVFFSAQRFPDVIQPVIKALPLTAVIDAMRAQMLEGATLMQVLPQLGVLTAWLLVSFVLALKLFRWR